MKDRNFSVEVAMDKHKLHDEIARVAYSLYERRGRLGGYAEQDWLEAEKIVMARYQESGKKEVNLSEPERKKPAKQKEEAPAKKTASKKKPASRKKEYTEAGFGLSSGCFDFQHPCFVVNWFL